MFASASNAAIWPDQVLVVHNSPSADCAVVLAAYLAAHPDIPLSNILDLNSTTLVGVANVTYAEFVQQIRNPIRAYLDLPGDPTPAGIVSIVLIHGIPHRIQDTNYANVGDSPVNFAAEFQTEGDANCASVDSELTLLWQNLDTGEAGGAMDSRSDNMIDNPYHMGRVGIDSYSRTNIKAAKSFSNLSDLAWQSSGSGAAALTPGDLYLVCRIDGRTAAEALAALQRAQYIAVNTACMYVILDEDDRPDHLDDDDLFGSRAVFSSGADFENARNNFQGAGWKVLYDGTSTFLQSTPWDQPVIAYSSYGENHNANPPGTGTYASLFTYAGGAVFNTAESYNGRAFNGLGTLFGQEQVADFLGAGGTFGVGHVWEPFSFTIPDNDYLFNNFFLKGMTWGEAAWSSIPALSWMHVVVGDPLARVDAVASRPADLDWNGIVDDADVALFTSYQTGAGVGPVSFPASTADLDADGDVDQSDFGRLQAALVP